MNKIIVILTVISLACLFCQCDKNVKYSDKNDIPTEELIITEGSCFPDVADKYVYPIKYKSDEWYQLLRDGEILKACQLPDNVLKSISTLGLIRSFIDVPNSFRQQHLYSNRMPYIPLGEIYSYNSSKELLTRKDAVKSLIAYYAVITLDCQKFSEDCWKSYEDCYELICGSIESDCFELLGDCFKILNDCDEQREFPYQLYALEWLFATPEIVGSMNHEDKVEVVKLLLDRNNQWINMGYYVNTGINPGILYVMGWIMYDDMIPYFDQKSLDSIKYVTYTESLIDDVFAFAESFIIKK